MTFRELKEQLDKMSEDDLDLTVTIWDIDNGEFYPGEFFTTVDSNGILDSGHPFIGFNWENWFKSSNVGVL